MRSEGRRNSSRVLLSKENDKSRKTGKKKKDGGGCAQTDALLQAHN